MFLVAGHDKIRFSSYSTLQNHLIARIRRRTGHEIDREDEQCGFCQRIRPFDEPTIREFQSEFFGHFVIFSKHCRTDGCVAPSLRPCSEAIQRLAPPKGRAHDDVGVEDHLHLSAPTANSLYSACNRYFAGRSHFRKFPSRQNQRTDACWRQFSPLTHDNQTVRIAYVQLVTGFDSRLLADGFGNHSLSFD